MMDGLGCNGGGLGFTEYQRANHISQPPGIYKYLIILLINLLQALGRLFSGPLIPAYLFTAYT